MDSDASSRALELLRRHGWNATSFQILEPGIEAWFDGDDAVVGYVDTGSAWVAAGAPIAAEDAMAGVARRFVAAAAKAGRRACFFAVEPRFVSRAGLHALQVGEQPAWDPASWARPGRASRSTREQLRRARAKGVKVRAAPPEEIADEASPTRRAVDAVIAAWERARPMAPMGFMVTVHPFSFPEERRYFVAECNGRLAGFLAAVPVYARGGWFLEDLVRAPDAPNGTAELLVHHAMQAASAEGSRYATLGLAPLAGDIDPVLRVARSLSAPLYGFRGVFAFKAKLRPDAWAPIYLAYGGAAPLAIYDTLVAFSRGGLLRFGVETLLRVPNVVVQLLAALLVPWTLALALVDRAAWFPWAWVQMAWVAFDSVLFVALWALTRRFRSWLLTSLAIAITLDALVTLIEVVVYNAPRARGILDPLVMATAVLAPASAAALLWRARYERSRHRVASAEGV